MGFVIVLDRVDTCLHSKLSKSLPVMADRLKSVKDVGMGSGKNNAGMASPTSPHVSRANLEMRSEAAMFYAVIKGDDLVMTRICLLEVISHSRKGGSRGGYISGSALKVYDDCQRRYLSGGNLPHK